MLGGFVRIFLGISARLYEVHFGWFENTAWWKKEEEERIRYSYWSTFSDITVSVNMCSIGVGLLRNEKLSLLDHPRHSNCCVGKFEGPIEKYIFPRLRYVKRCKIHYHNHWWVHDLTFKSLFRTHIKEIVLGKEYIN